jgi:hypothetical protein
LQCGISFPTFIDAVAVILRTMFNRMLVKLRRRKFCAILNRLKDEKNFQFCIDVKV